MPFVLVIDGVVAQKQPNEQDFFIAAPDWVVCGYLYADGVFTAPAATQPAPTIPELSPRQIRRGLASIGITEDQVEALLLQLPDADDALIDWRYANSYRRDHPLVGALIIAFQLTEAEVDTLWLWAAEI